MSKARSAAAIRSFLCGATLAMFFCATSAGQDLWRHLRNTPSQFNQEAAASDPDGIHKYSYDLARSIVPVAAGADYINSFANRLAKAEQQAREGKRKLVSEADVVRAFNEMMRRSGTSPPVTADADGLRRFRAHGAAIGAFPALLSADRNGRNCNPGEAVYLILLLERNKGLLSESSLDREVDLESNAQAPEEQVVVQPPVDPAIMRPPENPGDLGIVRHAENPEDPGVALNGRNFSQLITETPVLTGTDNESARSLVRRQERFARRQHHAAIKQADAVAKVLGF
jgi:hypothetical protein